NAQQRDFAETIQSSGETLLTLINEILDFSKLEAGEMDLEMLDFDVSTCLEEVAELFAAAAHTRQLELVTLVYRNLPTGLKGDVGRLRQILTNLVSNAVKFTHDGEVVIQAALRSETDTTATIAFSVVDTGIGIPAAAQQKLFQPFSQVDASTTRRYGGTGLGLAISKQLVELMGGEIGVESSEGQGSRFWFTLTFEKQTATVSPDLSLAVIPQALSQLRLLIVDDNATNRKIVRYQISAWGMSIDEADSATTALARLRDQAAAGTPYNLAILDMQMPDMDGEMLARQIKADRTLSQTKLIMMTSVNHWGSAERALELGFSAYLVKPVRQSRLLDSIVNALLPLTTDQSSVAPRRSSVAVSATAPQRSKLKILLVEDNLVNQKVTLHQLKYLGYTADVAGNGQEALQLLKQLSYDLVLMDCQMPVLDGYGATQAIRQLDGNAKDVVIIALTANAMKEDQERCAEVGMNDYLSKPILKETLAAKLAQWSEVLEQRSVSERDHLPEFAIDWEHLHQICDNNAEFEQELLETFVEDAQLHLIGLEAALTRHDLKQLEQEAHHIKGASANLGLVTIQAMADQLELQARQNQLQGMPDLVARLHTSVGTVRSMVAAIKGI
ncbi:response regulator, partial [Leptolyngbya sp. FACHB-36]|uniref:response regulator n=1 Tax=Leptolyngbya sp. FACHB-36 TaxID=2692808 RepID=UPI0016815F8B